MTDYTPAFSWPAGHRTAISLLVHIPGHGFRDGGDHQDDQIGLDYTPQGVRHLLRVLADIDVTATFAFTSEAIEDAPELLAEVHDADHELAVSNCSTTGSIEDVIDAIADQFDLRVNGLVASIPGFPTSELEIDWGSDSGMAWLIDGRSGDLPSLQTNPNVALIPTSPYLIDTAWLSPQRPLPPSSLLEAWMLALDAHREGGIFMPIVIHPHIIGRPGFLGTLTRFLDDVIARGDVWIAPMQHIAATWHAYYAELGEDE